MSGAPPNQAGVFVTNSSSVVGSRIVSPEETDRAFAMPVGKLRSRAGLESLAYAEAGEDEVTLGLRAALQAAGSAAAELDWIIATSETHRSYPSLAAQLHARLLAPETCAALDVGGACFGLINAFSVAHAFLASGQARAILVVTADVHSRVLAPGLVAGEFGGLFGDGASAFVLRAMPFRAAHSYQFGEFLFGCASQYAGAIRVAPSHGAKLDVHFDGEALSRAAITRLEKVIAGLEQRSGIARASLLGLATHQPNPRLVALLARQCGLSEEKFPVVARKFGNLGSATCGVALDLLLQGSKTGLSAKPAPIFLASLGPGLLFGGTWLF